MFDDEEYNQLKARTVVYVFKENINRVWNMIKNIEKNANTVFDEYKSDFFFTKGTNSYTEGHEFKVTWKNWLKIIGKVTKYFKKRSTKYTKVLSTSK